MLKLIYVNQCYVWKRRNYNEKSNKNSVGNIACTCYDNTCICAPTDTDTTTDTPIATPTAAPSTSIRFTDINSEEFAWAKSYINDMAGKGFISGYEDNTFRPDNDVTRLEALSLFCKSNGSNDSANTNYWKSAHDKFDSVIKMSTA